MALQPRLSLLPPDAELLSPELALVRDEGRVILLNGGGPVLCFDEDDVEGRRLAAAIVCQPAVKLAAPKAVAEGLGISRSMVFDYRRRYLEGGPAGLLTQRSGPKGPHKLEGKRAERAQALLDDGESNRAVARAVEVSEGAVRLALKQGRLKRPKGRGAAQGAKGPRERSDEDRQGPSGVAVKRTEERVLAAAGALSEAPPLFAEAQESVAKAGVLVALPALVAQGLYEVGHQVYGKLRNGYFGLNAVLSTLAFMALLRIKTPEQLSSHAPGEFGLVLGLDRAPEVNTLRRKVAEMGNREQALAFQAAFAERWAKEQPELLGFLYVDGHVRPYHGRKHALPKTHVPRRRLCMPATTDYWVNDAFADPLFYVTAPGNEGLLATLNEAVLPGVRELVGPGRRVTLVMDRECWSPKSFENWSQNGFDVLTYRKGRYDPWPEGDFQEHESREGAKGSVTYKLAEQPLTLSNGFEVREVRCRTEDGHQTSVVTTRTDLSVLEIAERMFSRWQQEHFFRYMRHEFALDHLPTYGVEPADPERAVPNPAKKEKKKELDGARAELARLKQAYAESSLNLGADNLIIITILANKLPPRKQALAVQVGLILAMLFRIILLAMGSWLLTYAVGVFLSIDGSFLGLHLEADVSIKALVLAIGGLVLIWKGVKELRVNAKGIEDEVQETESFGEVMAVIVGMNLLFSVDSILTVVGMTDIFAVMVGSVVISVALMLAFAAPLARFLHANPDFAILGLFTLLLMFSVDLYQNWWEEKFRKKAKAPIELKRRKK